MQTNLLPELDDSQDDLLPVGTRVFPTTLRLRPEFYHVLLFLIVAAPLLFIVAAVVDDSGGAGIVALLGLLLALCCTLALLFIRIGDARTYAAQVKSGKWHYGAIVFPGGDIVVRDVLPCGRTELHVERMHLQRAVVRPGRSWRTMFLLEPHVVIRRTELTGETREFAFPASAFADSAQLIVACMNAGAHGSGDRGRAGNGGNGGGREGGDRRGGESGDVA